MQVQKLLFRCDSFTSTCADLDIEHRLTKALPSKVEGPRHSWTNGQVEQMSRTIREMTVERYYRKTHGPLRHHLTDFVPAYKFARCVKILRGLTPYESICKAWRDEPGQFISNPHHQSVGPNKKCVEKPYRVATTT
jgi:hypothetical protein